MFPTPVHNARWVPSLHGGINAYVYFDLITEKKHIPADALLKNRALVLKIYTDLLESHDYEIRQVPKIPIERTVLFNVDYGKEPVIQKIELMESQTLDDLSNAIILQSFKWDDPHMYSFFFDNKLFSKNKEKTYGPRTFDIFDQDDLIELNGKSSTIELGDLELRENQVFLFLFDYGDEHVFKVKVLGFSKTQNDAVYPQIFESVGKPPKQYPSLEEE
jgi:hypothetical protein